MTSKDDRPLGLREVLKADLAANRDDPRVQLLLVLFRTTGRLRTSTSAPVRLVGKALTLAYRGYASVVMSIDLPTSTRIGPGVRIRHGYALVVHDETVIGRDVTLRHSTTIGERGKGAGAPVIGDGVDLGAQVAVLGPVEIGAGSRIGSGAVVLTSCPPGSTMVGNPARVLPRA